MLYCPHCGGKNWGENAGSFAITIILLIVFFPAAIIYEICRGNRPKVCQACRREGMIAEDSPLALMYQLWANRRQTDSSDLHK